MSLKKWVVIISAISITYLVNADIPVEVLSSCKQLVPVNASLVMTALIAPESLGDD